MLKSMIIAFSTYSRIPMPQIPWDTRSMKFAICWFPLIGAVIGLAELGCFFLAGLLHFSGVLRGAVSAAVPLLITGGIHMDGFCDTSDALACWQSRERRLEILKDPHCGAFAVIFCALWMLLYFAGWYTCAGLQDVLCAASGFILSRALSALALNNWKNARGSGMLHEFSSSADRGTVNLAAGCFLLLAAAGLLIFGSWRGCAVLAAAAVCFGCYRYTAFRYFGGITGDLAGWFTQLCELGVILALAVTEAIG